MRLHRIIALSTLIAACGSDASDSGHHMHDDGGANLPSDFDPTTELTAHSGAITISYTTNPAPIPESLLFSITFTVSEGATVVGADATMPTHGGHGMTVEPQVTDNGDGTFTATPFEFHMPGYWVIHALVADTSGTEERVDFDVDCCE